MPNENPVKTVFLQVVVKILATVRYNLMVLEDCAQLVKILFMSGCLSDFWLCMIWKFVDLCPTDRYFQERNGIDRLSCKKICEGGCRRPGSTAPGGALELYVGGVYRDNND